jgi:hypothetical protein
LKAEGLQSSVTVSDTCSSTFTDIYTANFRTDTITYESTASQSYSADATGSSIANLHLQLTGSSSASVTESKTTGFLQTWARASQSRNVCFTVAAQTNYHLSGQISGAARQIGYDDSGYGEVALMRMGGGGILYDVQAGSINFFGVFLPVSATVASTGTLAAGNYCLLVDLDVALETYSNPRSTSGAFNVVLQLGP